MRFELEKDGNGLGRLIERNSERLFTVVAALVAMVRVHGGGIAAFLPRDIYSAAMILLQSAVRRLIIIAARGLALKLRPGSVHAFPSGLGLNKNTDRIPAFCLIDPLKRLAREDSGGEKPRSRSFPASRFPASSIRSSLRSLSFSMTRSPQPRLAAASRR
jgi:hypothetical protein